MGCPCTQNAGAKAFVYVAPDGTKTERRTEVEALAIRVRAGGVGEVRPVPAK
jgi:hypothetical protein